MTRELATTLGHDTVAYQRAGGYLAPSGRFVELTAAIEASTRGTVEYPPERALRPAPVSGPPPRITVANQSILVVGRRMAATGPVAGLNFASATSPGGGFLNGALAMRARTRKVLAVAAAHGQRRLILGAWGCGAFGLDGDMMAGIFAEALAGQGSVFDEVVFAVTDWSPSRVHRHALDPPPRRHGCAGGTVRRARGAHQPHRLRHGQCRGDRLAGRWRASAHRLCARSRLVGGRPGHSGRAGDDTRPPRARR